jgi:AhpD family alkylhydroperoxidase
MSRQDIERDIVKTMGEVPPFYTSMPDDVLEREWYLFKSFAIDDTAISAKNKHLIGLAVAAATHCPYCTYFHKSAAQMLGATEQECEEASRFAAMTTQYSTYLHGLQVNLKDFREMTDRVGKHMQAQQAKMAA